MPLIFMLFLIGSCVTYRVSRFIKDDTLIAGVRDRFMRWLMPPQDWFGPGGVPQFPKQPALWRRKLHELLTCPYCLSIWVAAGVTVGTDLFYDLPLPLFWWLALSGQSLVFWRYIEDN